MPGLTKIEDKKELKDSVIYPIIEKEIENGSLKEIEIKDKDYFNISISKCQFIFFGRQGLGAFVGHYGLVDIRKFSEKIEDEWSEPYYIACVTGGENNKGDWQTYFCELSIVIGDLKKYFDVNVVKINNDILDDVHYLYLILKRKE